MIDNDRALSIARDCDGIGKFTAAEVIRSLLAERDDAVAAYAMASADLDKNHQMLLEAIHAGGGLEVLARLIAEYE